MISVTDDWAADEITKYGLRDDAWPILEPAAFHGPLGEAATEVAHETEADAAAILATLVTAFGSTIPEPHVRISATDHHARLFVAIVGDTSRGAKGESWSTVEGVMRHVEPSWMTDFVQGGFASGEAVIENLSEGNPCRLILEQEFSTMIKRSQREGSILSPTIRAAWDGSPLENRKVGKVQIATGHHIAVVAHITPDELRRVLRTTEIANGFGNRFLYIASRRSRLLPFGGSLPDERLEALGAQIREAADRAHRLNGIDFSDDARPMWKKFAEANHRRAAIGIVGTLTARARPQTLRMALIFAAADGSPHVGPVHLEAAIALWRYSDASVRLTFDSATGDKLADRLLLFLRQSSEGLSMSDQRQALGHNYDGGVLRDAGDILVSLGVAERDTRKTKGRPSEILRFTHGVSRDSAVPEIEVSHDCE